MTQTIPAVAPSALGAGEPPKWRQNGNASELTSRYFLRSDAGPTGINAAESIPPEAIEAFRRDIAAGILIPDNDTARGMAQSFGGWRAGDITPLGPLINELPGGLTSEQWQAYVAKIQAETKIVIDQANARGWFGATPPRIDPATGMYDLNDPNLTFEARQSLLDLTQKASQNATARLLAEAEVRSKDAAITQHQQELDDARRAGDLNRAQQEAEFVRTLSLDRDKLTENARQFDNDLLLKTQQEAFDQAQAISAARADPRRSIEASFLATGRGGLAGLPAGNALTGTVPGAGTAGAAPGGQPAWANQLTQAALGQQPGAPGELLAGAAPGQPGGPDHYATVQRPDGTAVNYFGNVVRDGATGELANVPVGAFSRSLLEGTPVAANGQLGTQGGYTFGSALQAQGAAGQIDPNRIKMRSYLAGNDTEQKEALGVLSFATGQSDADLKGAFARNLPKQGAISGGARFTGSLMGGGGGSERIGGGPITKAAAYTNKKKAA